MLTDIRWKSYIFPKSTPTVFTVEVEDDKGKVTTEEVRFTVNHPPTIELTSPTNGAEFVSPATIALASAATDNRRTARCERWSFSPTAN